MTADALLRTIAGRDTTGLFEVRCRSPRSGRIVAREWFPVGDHGGCERFIAANAERLDVYVGVALRTDRKGGKAHIRHSWLLYVDADNAEAAARVRAFAPQPTLIVQSGTGKNVHAYWALTAPLSPAWFERANRRLSAHLGADVKVTDAARILRPPGSLNHKHDPPVSVTIEHYRRSQIVPVAQVVGRLSDPVPVRQPRARRMRANVPSADPLQGISADFYYERLTGREATAGNVRCPFHNGGMERTPSMRLYDTTWYCFVCCKGGSVYEFGAVLWDMGTRGAEFHRLRERLQHELGATNGAQ